MICNHCGRPARWVDNIEIYGRRFGKSYMMWWCEPCDAYVGCHHNTKKPKGRFLAKKDLRTARKTAHAIIDPLWQSGQYKRGQIYKMLADHFGREIHIGDTETVEECHAIIEASKTLFKEKIGPCSY
jgi:hypothetical protein